MEFIGLRLPKPLSDQVKAVAKKKDSSVSDLVRDFIELGLRIESLEDSPNKDKKLQALIYKMTLECGMLSRELIKNQTQISEDDRQRILTNTSKKSQEIIEHYLGDDAFKKESLD